MVYYTFFQFNSLSGLDCPSKYYDKIEIEIIKGSSGQMPKVPSHFANQLTLPNMFWLCELGECIWIDLFQEASAPITGHSISKVWLFYFPALFKRCQSWIVGKLMPVNASDRWCHLLTAKASLIFIISCPISISLPRWMKIRDFKVLPNITFGSQSIQVLGRALRDEKLKLCFSLAENMLVQMILLLFLRFNTSANTPC